MRARLALDIYPLENHVTDGPVAGRGLRRGDRVDDLLRVVVDHFTEDGVLPVEPARLADRDEELRPARTGSRVGTGQQVRPAELEVRVDLVLELVPRAAPSGTRRVAALDHEAADHPVEDGAVVVGAAAACSGLRVDVLLRPLGQPHEVAY